MGGHTFRRTCRGRHEPGDPGDRAERSRAGEPHDQSTERWPSTKEHDRLPCADVGTVGSASRARLGVEAVELDTSPEMYSGIFGQWAVYDADTAVSQLSFLLDSDDRNAAISGILETAYLEPDLIDQLFQRLEGAEAKRVAAEQIYYRLREDDPQSAERYRVRAGIAEEQGDGVTIVH